MKHFDFRKKALITALVFSGTFAFSQSKVTQPTMPVVPSVAKPSIGGGFYTPSSSGFYSGKRYNSHKNKKNEQQNSVSAKIENNISTETLKKNLNNQLLDGNIISTTNAQIPNPQKNITNQLTANDISNLGNLGLLESISGLLSNSQTKDLSLQNETQNSKILQEILSELKEIKANSSTSEKPVSFSNQEKSNQKVLRFTANNVDYMRTLKTVYFSKEEADGTFLLTGDLKYSVAGKPHNETFYILFKSIGIEMGTTKYSVSTSVSQDSEFDSFLKKISELSSNSQINATRTGNLVTMRVNEENLKFDLLLSMDN